MPTIAKQEASEGAQHYVRWNPYRSPYAIELKLDLVSRLAAEVAKAEKVGTEIGGILIGFFPDCPVPTLRIEEFELVPHSAENGPVYMLDPSEQDYFAAVRTKASLRGMSAVGFFRTHIRPGPLRPSLADRTLLSGQFKDPVYVVLLVEARQPHTGAFFLALNGQVFTDPAVQEFQFDERALGSAGEVQPRVAEEKIAAEKVASGVTQPRSRMRHYVLLALLLLIAVGIGIFAWPFLKGRLSSSDQLNLAVTGSDRLLQISWNHALPEVGEAENGTLVISDGGTHRVITLHRDELKFGVVEYERQNQHVQVTLTLNMPGSTSVTQSVAWQSR